MFDFDDPGEELDWMGDELLEEDFEEAPRRRLFRRKEESSTIAEREAVYVESKRREKEKGVGKFKFLAFLELLAILAILWGWIQWLY